VLGLPELWAALGVPLGLWFLYRGVGRRCQTQRAWWTAVSVWLAVTAIAFGEVAWLFGGMIAEVEWGEHLGTRFLMTYTSVLTAPLLIGLFLGFIALLPLWVILRRAVRRCERD
jgi:hypothetical protein